MERSRICNNKGFSLIELMVVLVIVGILTGIALPNVAGFMSQSEISEAAQTVAVELKKAREIAVSKNVRTLVWISDDGTSSGRKAVLYRQPMPGETLTSTDTTTVGSNPAITCYAVETVQISQKGNIGMNSLATSNPSGNSILAQQSIRINFKSSGTGGFGSGTDAGTVYLMPDKELSQNKRDKMRAITVSGMTGRVRIYTWNSGATSWQ